MTWLAQKAARFFMARMAGMSRAQGSAGATARMAGMSRAQGSAGATARMAGMSRAQGSAGATARCDLVGFQLNTLEKYG